MGRFSWLELAPAAEGSPVSPQPATNTDGLSLAAEAYREAQQLLDSGMYEPALRQFSRAIDEDRGMLNAWLGQTICQLALGEKYQAEVWARHMQERFPDDIQAEYAFRLCQCEAGHALDEVSTWLENQNEMHTEALPPFAAFARAVCRFKMNQSEASQNELAAMLRSLKERSEQVRWVTLVSAFFLRERLADGACSLLEALEEAQALNSYGLSLWIKAEWLRGERRRAQELLNVLRQRDGQAVVQYDVCNFLDETEAMSSKGVKGYLMGWLNRFGS